MVEVLSDSTEAVDRGEKFYNYRAIKALQTYVLAHQDRRRVEVFRRLTAERWSLETLEGEAALELPRPPTALALAAVYRGLDFGSGG